MNTARSKRLRVLLWLFASILCIGLVLVVLDFIQENQPVSTESPIASILNPGDMIGGRVCPFGETTSIGKPVGENGEKMKWRYEVDCTDEKGTTRRIRLDFIMAYDGKTNNCRYVALTPSLTTDEGDMRFCVLARTQPQEMTDFRGFALQITVAGIVVPDAHRDDVMLQKLDEWNSGINVNVRGTSLYFSETLMVDCSNSPWSVSHYASRELPYQDAYFTLDRRFAPQAVKIETKGETEEAGLIDSIPSATHQ
ncbi:MAG: hypothetical protein IID44_14065 [Planctomycetes bacterium]|nr:hypothetical protein [Planctomycetota bacterium]